MDASALPQPFRRLAAPLLARLADGHLAQVVRGAAMVMGIRIGGAAIALLSQVLLARWMGAFEYGIFAYVWVWVIILGILAPMGFGTSTLRFVPDYRVNGKWRRLAGILDASWRMVMIFGLAAMGVGPRGCSPSSTIRSHPIICCRSPSRSSACRPSRCRTRWKARRALSAGSISPICRPISCARSASSLAGGIVYLALGELTGLAAVGGALVAALLTLAGQKLLLSRRIARTIPKAKPVHHTRHWIMASMPLVLAEGLYLVLLNSDIVLLGAFVDPDHVGIYFAATRIVNLITFIYFAVAALAVPKFAELHAKGDRACLQAFVHDIIQWIFWPTLAAAVFILLFGKFALGLFGQDFSAGYPLLAILMLGFLARASTGPIEYLLNMTGNQNVTAGAYGGAATLNIALNLVLIPRFGLEGAAAATAVSLVFASVWLFIAVRRRLGISAFVFTLAGARALGPA